MNTRSRVVSGLVLSALLAGSAWAGSEPTFSRMVVFGDSLSDPGNVFASTGLQSVPPYPDINPVLRIPGAPYATGGHHFSNGQTWVEQLSRDLRRVRDAKPALRVNGARNYAFGGAQACESSNPFDLERQVDLFLAGDGASGLGNDLVIIFVGGNDVRADLEQGGTGAVIGCAVGTIVGQVVELVEQGATRFLVANAPDVGLTPAIQALGEPAISGASALSNAFNVILTGQLASLRSALGVQIEILDVAGALEDAISGDRFDVTDSACITPLVPPFRCRKAGEYLFWDGIHPTRAGHDVLRAQALADLSGATPPLIE
jgi:phospholipase/lecithinase/hemolysin